MRKTTLTLCSLLTLFLLPALAVAEKKVLTVYTYESFTAEWGPGPKVKQAFEKTCGCTLNYVSLADGVALLTRIRMEGDTTKADIVLGLDNSLVAEAGATGACFCQSVLKRLARASVSEISSGPFLLACCIRTFS